MHRYNVIFRYSRNGTSFSQSSTFVNASSSSEASRIVKAKYPNCQILDVKETR